MVVARFGSLVKMREVLFLCMCENEKLSLPGSTLFPVVPATFLFGFWKELPW